MIFNVGAGNGGSVVYVTQAEYDALPDSKLTNNIEYRITDGDMGVATASNLSYDNSFSGLEAVSVQGAVDELNESLKDYSENIMIARVSTNSISVAQQNFSRQYVSYTPPTGYSVMKAIPSYCSEWCGFVTACTYEPNNKRVNIVCANFHTSDTIDAIFGCEIILKKI